MITATESEQQGPNAGSAIHARVVSLASARLTSIYPEPVCEPAKGRDQ